MSKRTAEEGDVAPPAKRAKPARDAEFVLFYTPAMETLAQAILSHKDVVGRVSDGAISWGFFEDGFPNIKIENTREIRHKHAVFLASFLDQGTLLSQLSLIYSLPRYMVRSLMVVLPYFPTGTMERVDVEGQVATAKSLARMLSAVPMSTTGPATLTMFDIHALQERFYFEDSILPILETAIPMFRRTLEEFDPQDVAIAFPDDGAAKRFGRMFPEYNVVVCIKVRDGDKRIVTIKEGSPGGKHCFIVDDLVKTGGTLIQCKNALLEAGAKQVSAFVTHAVFPQDSWKRFALDTCEDSQPFAHFFTTDSCPEISVVIQDRPPFRVLSLADSLVQCVLSSQKPCYLWESRGEDRVC